MAAIDNTHDRIFEELREFRTEMREFRAEVRSDIRELRGDLNNLASRLDRFQDRMVQVGFGLLGVTIASISAIFIALIFGGG